MSISVPKFVTSATGILSRMSDEEGAEWLADMIRQRWAQCGYAVDVKVVTEVVKVKAHRTVYGIRSNLVNGMPPASAKLGRAA